MVTRVRKKIKEKKENETWKKQNNSYYDCFVSGVNLCYFACFANR
jgi:hypothetical protein